MRSAPVDARIACRYRHHPRYQRLGKLIPPFHQTHLLSSSLELRSPTTTRLRHAPACLACLHSDLCIFREEASPLCLSDTDVADTEYEAESEQRGMDSGPRECGRECGFRQLDRGSGARAGPADVGQRSARSGHRGNGRQFMPMRYPGLLLGHGECDPVHHGSSVV